jgi:hypothetical protein
MLSRCNDKLVREATKDLRTHASQKMRKIHAGKFTREIARNLGPSKGKDPDDGDRLANGD